GLRRDGGARHRQRSRDGIRRLGRNAADARRDGARAVRHVSDRTFSGNRRQGNASTQRSHESHLEDISMARSRFRSTDEAAVDMTPMLDVVFIMLIFFIVTASFVKEAGVDVNRPNAETAEQQNRGNIMIAIRPNGEVWVDRRPVDVRALRANVERLRAEKDRKSVVILADRESQTGLLVEVMDQVRLAGVSNVAIAADEAS